MHQNNPLSVSFSIFSSTDIFYLEKECSISLNKKYHLLADLKIKA